MVQCRSGRGRIHRDTHIDVTSGLVAAESRLVAVADSLPRLGLAQWVFAAADGEVDGAGLTSEDDVAAAAAVLPREQQQQAAD